MTLHTIRVDGEFHAGHLGVARAGQMIRVSPPTMRGGCAGRREGAEWMIPTSIMTRAAARIGLVCQTGALVWISAV